MGFDAAKRVEPLDYDFTTLNPVPTGLEDCKGTIAEPTTTRLQAFLDGYYSLLEMLHSVDPRALKYVPETDDGKEDKAPQHRFADMASALDAWESREDIHREDRVKAEQVYTELITGICGGAITKEQVAAMPARIRTEFLSWLIFELGPGKDLANAMTDSLVAATSE